MEWRIPFLCHHLIAALVEFRDELFVVGRGIDQWRDHSAAAVGKKLYEISGNPVVVIPRARVSRSTRNWDVS